MEEVGKVGKLEFGFSQARSIEEWSFVRSGHYTPASLECLDSGSYEQPYRQERVAGRHTLEGLG